MDTLFYAGITLDLITDVLGPGKSGCSYYYLPLAYILNKTSVKGEATAHMTTSNSPTWSGANICSGYGL